MTEPSALIPPVLQAVHIRFLNASTAPFPIDVLIDGMEHLQNSSFGTVSQYIPMADGFHKIAVRSRAGLRPVLFQGVFPFPAGQKITFSIADSPSGSITIIPVSNAGCFHCPARCGCYRIANMTFSGSSYDIRTPSGERVFCSISFGQSAPYNQFQQDLISFLLQLLLDVLRYGIFPLFFKVFSPVLPNQITFFLKFR